MFDTDKMRARFAELNKERGKIEAKTGPLRDEQAKVRAEARAAEGKLVAKIRAAENGLPEIDQEMGMIARALKNWVGRAEPSAEVLAAEAAAAGPADTAKE